VPGFIRLPDYPTGIGRESLPQKLWVSCGHASCSTGSDSLIRWMI